MTNLARHSTGVAGLDERLGGGLIPGTLTVIVGASGIGKTQFGLQFARAGTRQEGRPGFVFDMTARIDSQCHAEYARRMFDWRLEPAQPTAPADVFAGEHRPGDYLSVFAASGKRVTRRDLDFDAWHDWQAQLAGQLNATIGFFYGNFIRGARRAVIDGIEPAERPSESIQFELFEYVYHQVLRKEHDWLARDLLRQQFRAHEPLVAKHAYDHAGISCVALLTAHEMLLDDLIARPLADGDLLANANTLIYLGKLRDGTKLARGLAIVKHRGSACSDEIVRYEIGNEGLRIV